ncbi:RING-H2 finger protein ATL16, partial [Cucurbita argyrosperma subsp. argyrosperma]|uniref:RING-type E3 ubiquitin transferase n=1 Tax=Cucurbita moschata TaxID=3662 RepID=A0A6J1ERC0_CUCMO
MPEILIGPSFGSLHSSTYVSSFPIIAVAVVVFCATAIFLVGYYIFAIRGCFNWHPIEILHQFSLSDSREDTVILQEPVEPHGLDPLTIQSIPLIRYKKPTNESTAGSECAVCLMEFQPEEELRKIPICSHLFHVDCIDIWFQNNSNCPLCRATISAKNWLIPADQPPSPQDSAPNFIPIAAAIEEFPVIEVVRNPNRSRPHSSIFREASKSGRKLTKVTSMGDECIDMRKKDEEFFLMQPIRRSFSMDSSSNRKMFVVVQAAVRQNCGGENEIEGCSNRIRRSFFSFGKGKGSRNAILPIQIQP